MSLASPYQEHYYIADGETTRFSFGEYFSAPTSANVKCIIYFEDGTSCVPSFNADITTGYIDIIALTTPDGQVLNAPPAGSTVRVFRDTPEQQNVTASQLQNYTAKQLEKVFDSIVAMIQEVSYSDKHKTLRLTETQRDVFLAFLKEANDDALLYWDNETKTIVPTDFVRQDVVRMSGGLFFRMKHDSQLRPYLEWSINGQTDWHSLNWQSAKDVADEAKEIAEEARDIAQSAKDVADDAKDVADEAKEIAEGIDGKAQQALDNSVEALETAEEAKEMIQDQIIVRSATIPTASADLVGKAYQYSGTTNGVYTHNYIYECVAQTTTETLIMFDPVSTGKLAFDYQNHSVYDLFERIAAIETTFNAEDVVTGSFRLDKANELWYISGYDANGDALFTDFTVEATGGEYCLDDYGYIYTFPFPQDYEDEHTEDFRITQNTQTDYVWQRSDVQPDRIAQIQALQAEVSDIEALIPAQATPQNQLGDKAFINSSIATNTANFIGTFNSVAELEAYSGTVTNNDYAFVIGTDLAGNTTYNRYKYNANTQQWIYEYTLNNSSFTADQWAAINSGVTASDVSKARSAVQPSDVGNGTITITQGGTTKGSFTTNQDGNTTIDLDAGGSGSDFDLFDTKWRDATTNNTRWLLSDGNWKTNTNAYQHLVDDVEEFSTATQNANLGANLWRALAWDGTKFVALSYTGYISTSTDGTTWTTAIQNTNLGNNNWHALAWDGTKFVALGRDGYISTGNPNIQTETVAGVTVTYYQADDGHKICPASQESNVTAIYNATGGAWYYIIDTTNQRFKLPRSKHNKYADSLGVVGNGIILGLTNGTINGGLFESSGSPYEITARTGAYGQTVGSDTGTGTILSKTLGVTTDPTKSGIIAQQTQDTDQYKYLYFYVGN